MFNTRMFTLIELNDYLLLSIFSIYKEALTRFNGGTDESRASKSCVVKSPRVLSVNSFIVIVASLLIYCD